MDNKPTIVIVLRSGGDFTFRDVELIARHINGKWRADNAPRIVCLWDKASQEYNLGNLEIIPLRNNWPKWWSRMTLYSPEMEKYRPFLYVDLDTVVVQSLENIFNLVYSREAESKYITLEDFYQKGLLATGLAWIPAKSEKIKGIWDAWQKTGPGPSRMDYWLRTVTKQDIYWQELTKTVLDSKPKGQGFLPEVPEGANLICFHGKPRIFQAAEASMSSGWVRDYVETQYSDIKKPLVTVIIPYKEDRGWLKDAIASVPKDCQLLVSQGEGNWPANFNKVLSQAEGKYIKYLHEDDMLTPNCIEDSVKALEEQDVDFIHGNAYEIFMNAGRAPGKYIPKIQTPTLENLLVKNVIHSATLMYRREIFERIGSFEEGLNTAEEYEFNLRCLRAGYKIGYCDSFLAWYRRHPKQKVRTVPKEEKDREREMVRKLHTV